MGSLISTISSYSYGEGFLIDVPPERNDFEVINKEQNWIVPYKKDYQQEKIHWAAMHVLGHTDLYVNNVHVVLFELMDPSTRTNMKLLVIPDKIPLRLLLTYFEYRFDVIIRGYKEISSILKQTAASYKKTAADYEKITSTSKELLEEIEATRKSFQEVNKALEGNSLSRFLTGTAERVASAVAFFFYFISCFTVTIIKYFRSAQEGPC